MYLFVFWRSFVAVFYVNSVSSVAQKVLRSPPWIPWVPAAQAMQETPRKGKDVPQRRPN